MWNGVKALLLCPQTYMNRSGSSVLAARDFYKIDHADLLVVCDDFNLPLAKLRVRSRGSAGGQRGLQDIIRRLGTDEFPRLRIGIGTPPPSWDAADFVLSKFAKDEEPAMDAAVCRAADAVVAWATQGIATAMNQYNADPIAE
jgi:PTH1 family peptidyl-tRNA hydrolase